MAVYKRSYKGYAGALTPAPSRFLILARYSYARLMRSKFVVIFLAVCMFYPLACLTYIYASHNPAFVARLAIPGGRLPPIDGRFFYFFCNVQGGLAYLLTAFVSPALITSDLANGALPLFFCRPFSRHEYVAAKMSLLLTLLSLFTWIPGLVLFAIESSLSGWNWMQAHLWIAGAIFLGLVVWIVTVTLIGLALSAWVKWKIVAGALVLGVFFAGAGFGAAINSVMRTNTGTVIDLTQVMHTIWSHLFRYDSGIDMSLMSAWSALGVTCAICLWLLARRIRAFEVVK
jgi:ABC-type transport system involved in multi-copper enzyme maturation permease subunit